MRKKNLKEHTTKVHDKNLHPKERHETSEQPKLSFGKRPAEVDDNEKYENIQKKVIIQVDLSNSTDLYTDEVETEGKPEGEPEPQILLSNARNIEEICSLFTDRPTDRQTNILHCSDSIVCEKIDCPEPPVPMV